MVPLTVINQIYRCLDISYFLPHGTLLLSHGALFQLQIAQLFLHRTQHMKYSGILLKHRLKYPLDYGCCIVYFRHEER